MECPSVRLAQLIQQLQNSEIGASSIPLTERKAEELNRRQGDLKLLDCELCLNKGYIAYVKDDVLTTKECSCVAKRRAIERMDKSGLTDLLEIYTFGTYQMPEAWQSTAKEKALDYIERGCGKWFMITGTPGTGKTHLCTAICGALLNAGKGVRYMLWRDEAPKLKALVNDRDAYEPMMNELKRADVLYIDDFFKGSITGPDIKLAFELLNARYNSRKKMTLISTERTVEELLDIDEALGSRIYERSKEYAIRTPVANWRLRK